MLLIVIKEEWGLLDLGLRDAVSIFYENETVKVCSSKRSNNLVIFCCGATTHLEQSQFHERERAMIESS